MGQASVTETVSRQIAATHMQMLMENVLQCTAQAEQTYSMTMQVGGNLDIGELGVNLQSMQQINCIANQDLSAMMSDKFKSQLDSKVQQTLSGIASGANVNISKTKNDIINYFTSDTTIRNIQQQALKASQKINYDFQVQGNVTIGKASAQAAIDQIVSGSAKQVETIIKENTTSTATSQQSTQLLDGFLSGSTFTKIVYIVVAGGIVAAIISAIVALLQKKTEPEQQYYAEPQQEQIYYDQEQPQYEEPPQEIDQQQQDQIQQTGYEASFGYPQAIV